MSEIACPTIWPGQARQISDFLSVHGQGLTFKRRHEGALPVVMRVFGSKLTNDPIITQIIAVFCQIPLGILAP